MAFAWSSHIVDAYQPSSVDDDRSSMEYPCLDWHSWPFNSVSQYFPMHLNVHEQRFFLDGSYLPVSWFQYCFAIQFIEWSCFAWMVIHCTSWGEVCSWHSLLRSLRKARDAQSVCWWLSQHWWSQNSPRYQSSLCKSDWTKQFLLLLPPLLYF